MRIVNKPVKAASHPRGQSVYGRCPRPWKAGLMNMIIRGDGSALFGPSGQIGVARALGEFHAGRPVLVPCGDEPILLLPAEGLGDQRLNEFVRLCAPAAPRLIITARRAL